MILNKKLKDFLINVSFNIVLLFLVSINSSNAQGKANTTLLPPTLTTPTTTTTTKLITNPTTTSTTTDKPSVYKDCNLEKSSVVEKSLLEVFKSISSKQFSVKDKDHDYYFGICVKANNSLMDDQGFVQINRATGKVIVIGRLSDVDIEGGGKFIRVTYKNGDNYANACMRSQRSAVIYLFCNSQNSTETFNLIEENNDRDDGCAYVFELNTPHVCKNISSFSKCANETEKSSIVSSSHLGVFTIILVIIFSIFSIYLIVGTLYKRFVLQARGFEQIPNFRLWNSLGNKTADCCNLVCRCGQKPAEVHSYENINDRGGSDDENLLNM